MKCKFGDVRGNCNLVWCKFGGVYRSLGGGKGELYF